MIEVIIYHIEGSMQAQSLHITASTCSFLYGHPLRELALLQHAFTVLLVKLA